MTVPSALEDNRNSQVLREPWTSCYPISSHIDSAPSHSPCPVRVEGHRPPYGTPLSWPSTPASLRAYPISLLSYASSNTSTSFCAVTKHAEGRFPISEPLFPYRLCFQPLGTPCSPPFHALPRCTSGAFPPAPEKPPCLQVQCSPLVVTLDQHWILLRD